MCHSPEDHRLEERRVPQPGLVQSPVRVRSTGDCSAHIKRDPGAPLFWGDVIARGYRQAPVPHADATVGEVVALGEGAGEEVRPRDRRLRRLRADHALLAVPLLPARAVLDVPDPRYLRLPAEGVRLVGRVHAVAGERLELQGAARPAAAPRRVRRAAGLLHPRCRARRHPLPGHGGDRRLRPLGPRHGRGSQDEGPGARDRP